ncbi:polysaccharide deacetylase family protein [Leptothoe spongobia]|uniref:Polysaccharide deacetylase family protein n=1 Tax=Leptothoe spongobia TAU-MAC 1115 TaxID=1967444 RepID=A0A947DIH7_9CYAN|nr:polysaccharide deacetylase family protein [Leptothoe spongobia]MBT9317254.1 polysaccharide deacetylase family protein [Leptothoe spongobia TAU-MAC 1115]
MEACDLTVSPRAQSRLSPLRRTWGKVMLGAGVLLAFGGGLLYGAADAETKVVTQLTFSNQLQGSVGRVMASLPAPDLASIVFNVQSEDELYQTAEELDDVGQETFSETDYYCLPAPQTFDAANNIGQNLSTWGTQVNQSSQSQVSSWVANITAQLDAAQWPQVHERAQMARVPVVMYHDVLPEKEVFFDITPERLNADFRAIKEKNLTPISLDQLVNHLRAGVPLPEKPVVLTFDDGYVGHYDYVYRLAKYYRYPVAFSIFTDKVDGNIVGRSTVTWDHVEEMARDPLVTIVSHSVTHPRDLRELSDRDLRYELEEAKERLENKLGVPIDYFTYPEGNHDERVVEATEAAGYKAALIMRNDSGKFAGDSEDLLTIERFGESRFAEVIESAWGGPPLPGIKPALDFQAPVQRLNVEIDEIPMTLISGGQPKTIHADTRYPLAELVANSDAVAAVDGTFFSLEFLDSNTMIGPVLGRNTGEFIPGSEGDIYKLRDRPLVLMTPDEVKFISFDPEKHNTLAGIQEEMPDVTDAFVGAGWLVREQEPQSAATFKNLFAYEEYRFRAFWGINLEGQPVVGATHAQIDSVGLGEILRKAGFQNAVMLDSGASTSLVYEGDSLIGFESRTVPHAVVLVPTDPGGCGSSF